MVDLFWLAEAQVRRIEPFFPLSHGVPRVDDRRVIGIIFVIRTGFALARRTGGVWTIQDVIQPLRALEPLAVLANRAA